MISTDSYVAGWLDSSIHDFLDSLPRSFESLKYALITCLDSDHNPSALLETSPELQALTTRPKLLKTGLLVPTEALRNGDGSNRVFYGFDEVWFFPSDKIDPKPDGGSLVGPARIEESKLAKFSKWMSRNSCSLALGDGEGLNFIVKAQGLVKYLLGYSIEQPKPNPTFVVSPMNEARPIPQAGQ